MKVESKIKIIKDETGSNKEYLSILNNSTHADRVVLKYGDVEIQVNASELKKAISNAIYEH